MEVDQAVLQQIVDHWGRTRGQARLTENDALRYS